MPDVVQDVQTLLNEPASTANDLSRVIEKDAVISAKLISIANSPNYRGSGKVQTVGQAIGRLGFKEAQNIILAVANQMFYKTKNKQLRSAMEKMRLYSLTCAYGANQIATALGLKDAEKYFLMGLIHDIGNILLLWMLADIALQDDSLGMDEVILEINKLHQSFGAVLLERWKFAEELVNVARMHEGPNFDAGTPEDVLVVNLAGHMAFSIGYGFYEREALELSELEATKLLQISPDTLESIKLAVQDVVQKSSDSM
jgi:HD-like signal output (HDOD) protein